MKATTELAIRRAARVAAWALIALLGAGCAVTLFVSVAEHPVARSVLLALLGLLALASIAVFVLWAIGDVNRKRIEELEHERNSKEERHGEIASR